MSKLFYLDTNSTNWIDDRVVDKMLYLIREVYGDSLGSLSDGRKINQTIKTAKVVVDPCKNHENRGY